VPRSTWCATSWWLEAARKAVSRRVRFPRAPRFAHRPARVAALTLPAVAQHR